MLRDNKQSSNFLRIKTFGLKVNACKMIGWLTTFPAVHLSQSSTFSLHPSEINMNNKSSIIHSHFVFHFTALHGAHKSCWHFERSEAVGYCRALAGSSHARVLCAERSWEDGGFARDTIYGSRQGQQTRQPSAIHRSCVVAAFWNSRGIASGACWIHHRASSFCPGFLQVSQGEICAKTIEQKCFSFFSDVWTMRRRKIANP